MNALIKYIKSTFNYSVNLDAKQYSYNSKLQLLSKSQYNVYITPINFANFKHKQNEYKEHVKKAVSEWSKALNRQITFKIIDTPQNADIKVYWVKTTRKAAGLQYTEVNSGINTLCISIGIIDIDYTPFTSNEVYKIILHEFGHIFGLGHSPDKNDVMFDKWEQPDRISFNDKLVLNLIYDIGSGKTYHECEFYIRNYINNALKPADKKVRTNKNLLNDLCNIANCKQHLILQQNINFKFIPTINKI